jgi:hypothetical protein
MTSSVIGLLRPSPHERFGIKPEILPGEQGLELGDELTLPPCPLYGRLR